MKTFLGFLVGIFSGMVLMAMSVMEYDEVNDVMQYFRTKW